MDLLLNNAFNSVKKLNNIAINGGRKHHRRYKKTHKKGGGIEDEYVCNACVLKSSLSSSPSSSPKITPIPTPTPTPIPRSTSIPTSTSTSTPTSSKPIEGTLSSSSSQLGGSPKTIKGKYKKFLKKFRLEILQKEAKKKGIKITKKKNGKIVNIKKDSLINKLCKHKFPK
jgi:hypothetical protein